VTPLRRLTGWSWLAPQRRTLGLLCFSWACLHLATYVGLDLYFDWEGVFEDVAERPYITVGLAGFLCLVPLAVTSTRGWVRSLGRRWVMLHRLVYAAAILGVVHFLWQVKADLLEPLVYAGVLGTLLGVRLYWVFRRA
jgi:sulfoxide reductase heme-binding subunit YedZ